MAQPFDKMPAVMRRRAKEVSEGTTKIVQRAGSVVDRELVLNTPVDKGPARSNWVGTLNVPFTGTIPAYAPGNKLGLGERANAEAAIAQANVAIRLFRALRDKSLHFTNNIRYIEALNNRGTSSQVPAFFVQRAVQAAIVSVKGMKVLRK